ncbi:Uncharacterized protein dnl_30380 [Desulfonema limicola]|uniref:Uncharacterized protein n=1 Tax=Desulfonema limicola TaxID=45656 RepID=A0A975B8B1_9BACT|nr:Uncharacterized protein dnl_30380 [Desulfonema limicola]
MKSFNPCFHGSTTVRDDENIAIDAAVEFQSLFSWKYNCEICSPGIKSMTSRRFNPCFHGSTTVRLISQRFLFF